MNIKDYANEISLKYKAKIFGSASTAQNIKDITDVDAIEYLELCDKKVAKMYVERIQEIVEEKHINMEFVEFSCGYDPEYFYDSIFSHQIKYFDEKHFLNWMKNRVFENDDKKKIADILIKNKENSICAIIEINNLLKKYKSLIWNKTDVANGFVIKNGKKFMLEDCLTQKNTNHRIVYILNLEENFIELELSYVFFYKKDDKEYTYNQTNNDILYDILKFCCRKRYVKILKRLRSFITKLYFKSMEDTSRDYLNIIFEKYDSLFTHERLREIRNDLKKNVKDKYKTQSAQISRIKVILTMIEHNIFFGLTKQQFYEQYVDDIDLDYKKIEKKIDTDIQDIFLKYKKVLKKIVDII